MLPPFWMRPGLRNLIIWLAIHCFPLDTCKMAPDIYYHYYDYILPNTKSVVTTVRDSRYKLIHFYGTKKDPLDCNELWLT